MKIKSTLFGISLLVLLMIPLVGTSAVEEGLQYQELNKKVTLTYENITITANAGGQVPIFQLETEDGLAFNVMFKLLAEYLDDNEDGVFQNNETSLWVDEPGPPVDQHSNILALASIRWVFSGFSVEYADETVQDEVVAVHFNFTSDQVMDPFFADFEMEIRAHMYLDDQLIDGYTVLGGTELKFDIIMRNWEWQRNDTNLALRFDISPMNNQYQLNDTNGNAANTATNTTGSENKVQNQAENIKQNYTIGDENHQGHFAYATQAQYNISNTYQYREVNTSSSSLGDGTLQTFFSFEHFDTEVIYDPSIGTLSVDTIDDGEDSDNTEATGSLDIIVIGLSALMVTSIAVTSLRKKY